MNRRHAVSLEADWVTEWQGRRRFLRQALWTGWQGGNKALPMLVIDSVYRGALTLLAPAPFRESTYHINVSRVFACELTMGYDTLVTMTVAASRHRASPL